MTSNNGTTSNDSSFKRTQLDGQFFSVHLPVDNYKEYRFKSKIQEKEDLIHILLGLDRKSVTELADQIIDARIEYQLKIIDGLNQARGKLNEDTAVHWIHEYISSENGVTEFEFLNFSGSYEWANPKKLSGECLAEVPYQIRVLKKPEEFEIPQKNFLNRPDEILTFGRELAKPKDWDNVKRMIEERKLANDKKQDEKIENPTLEQPEKIVAVHETSTGAIFEKEEVEKLQSQKAIPAEIELQDVRDWKQNVDTVEKSDDDDIFPTEERTVELDSSSKKKLKNLRKKEKRAQRRAQQEAVVEETEEKSPVQEVHKMVLEMADTETIFDVIVKKESSEEKEKLIDVAQKTTTTVESFFSKDKTMVFIDGVFDCTGSSRVNSPNIFEEENPKYTYTTYTEDLSSNDEYVPSPVRSNESSPKKKNKNPVDTTTEDEEVALETLRNMNIQNLNSILDINLRKNPKILEHNDMFAKLKFVADKKARGGLSKLSKTSRRNVFPRLQKFVHVYNLRLRLAKCFLLIMEHQVMSETSSREEDLLRKMVHFMKENPSDEAQSLIAKDLDEMTRNASFAGQKDSDIIRRGYRFVELRMSELDKCGYLYWAYSKVESKLSQYMDSQKIILDVMGDLVDFTGYEVYL